MGFSVDEDEKIIGFNISRYRGRELRFDELSKINLFFGKYCKSEVLEHISRYPGGITDLDCFSRDAPLGNSPATRSILKRVFGSECEAIADKAFDRAASILDFIENSQSEKFLIDEINPYLFWRDYPFLWEGIIQLVQQKSCVLHLIVVSLSCEKWN
jgi:hypothetical protein